MEVIIQENPNDGCLLGAKIIAKKIRDKPNAVLGLATGRTPEKLYRELARMHREEGLDFSQVTTFNLDEYVGLPPEHDQHAECRDYEKRIKAVGGIDIQLLGLGRNGHIGFNEPTGSLRSRTWIKILSEQTLNDNAAVFGDPGSMPKHAVTMGIGTIMEARQIVLLAFGPAKVRAVMEMIEGPLAAVCPGSALQEHPRTTVVLDGNSSAGLQYLDHYRWIESHKLAWQRYD